MSSKSKGTRGAFGRQPQRTPDRRRQYRRWQAACRRLARAAKAA